jgi:hypothetical protein
MNQGGDRKEKTIEVTDPSLHGLSGLVGAWTTEATHPAFPSTVVLGRTTFEWLEGERFLIARARSDHPDFPDSISIIGETGGLRMHYFDSRGVARIYEMTGDGRVWTFSRTTPDFSPLNFMQRLTWTFSDDGQTIRGTSQICEDDKTWEDDLQITYRRCDTSER